jgi:hypothetical protein
VEELWGKKLWAYVFVSFSVWDLIGADFDCRIKLANDVTYRRYVVQ